MSLIRFGRKSNKAGIIRNKTNFKSLVQMISKHIENNLVINEVFTFTLITRYYIKNVTKILTSLILNFHEQNWREQQKTTGGETAEEMDVTVRSGPIGKKSTLKRFQTSRKRHRKAAKTQRKNYIFKAKQNVSNPVICLKVQISS